MIFRILAFFLLLFSILFAPFWISAILAIAGIIYFSKFFEAAVLFLLSDLLYGTKGETGIPIFSSFILAMIILIAIEIMKKKVRFYSYDKKNN